MLCANETLNLYVQVVWGIICGKELMFTESVYEHNKLCT